MKVSPAKQEDSNPAESGLRQMKLEREKTESYFKAKSHSLDPCFRTVLLSTRTGWGWSAFASGA